MRLPAPSPYLLLAPIRGITDCTYRSIAHEHFGGFDGAVAPFVSTIAAEKIPDSMLRDLAPEKNTALPVEPQLLGKSAPDFVRMAARVYDMGYPVVNLNMGCPFPKVANKGRGSGMLPEPDKVSDFLSETVPRMDARVSIKLRLGRSEPTEILALIPVLNRYPLAHLIIHPRVGRQMYTGRPDLETFEQCIEMIRHPVIYNGDVNAAADWEALSGRFPAVSGWMIGRGALCDPFLARAIKEGAAAYPVDAVAALEKFHDALYTAYRERLCGPGHLLDRMKGLWFYLSTGFADGRRFLKQIQKCRQVDAYGDLVDRFFDGSPQWSPRPPAAWH